jgi:serine/threonine protein kinase
MPVQTEESLFHAARVMASPSEQLAFLEEACGEDRELLARVQKLLEFHGCDESLEATSVSLGDTARIATLPAETQIGPYTLVEQIGEGGFGCVYLAEQTQPVKRQVALKILKPGMDSRQIVARFEAERQALALMDHPHIARIIDGGTTPEGRPYFVMELVRGEPITRYCDNERLTIRQRLELFVQVCQAVQHAHQKGIIHRDIKPNNVMVTRHDETPVPKVIDFGVAKAMNQTLTDKTIYTQFAQMIGTPLYMSPEQAQLSGLDIDTRSDVYSLGVLLYELLTSTTPFELEVVREKGIDELRRMIREEEPAQPSKRISTLHADAGSTISEKRSVDPRKLKRHLSGELDWIVMRALEKSRARRYQSAADLAEEVERYLTNRPVEASPPSTLYRVRKYVRRHRGLLATVAVVITALLAGTGISLWQAYEAGQARKLANERYDEAERERKRAEESYQMARDTIKRLLYQAAQKDVVTTPGMEILYYKLLREAVDAYTLLINRNPNDPKLYIERAEVHYSLSRRDTAVNAKDAAVNDLKTVCNLEPFNHHVSHQLAKWVSEDSGLPNTSVELAIEYADQAIALAPDNAEYRLTRACLWQILGRNDEVTPELKRVETLKSLNAWDYHRLSALYKKQGDFQAALIFANKAVELVRFDRPDHLGSLVHQGFGHLLADMGRDQQAIEEFTTSIDMNPAVSDARPSAIDPIRRRGELYLKAKDYANAIIDFDTVLHKLPTDTRAHAGRIKAQLQAGNYAEVAIDIEERLNQPHAHSSLNDVAIGLECYLHSRQTSNANDALLQKCVSRTSAFAEGDLSSQQGADQAAYGWWRLGQLAKNDSDSKLSETAFRQGLAIFERLLHDEPRNAFWRQEVAHSCGQLGNVQQNHGHSNEAANTYRRGSDCLVSLIVESPGNRLYHDRAFNQLFPMVDLLLEQNRIPEAVDGLKQASVAYQAITKHDASNAYALQQIPNILSRLKNLSKLASEREEWSAAAQETMELSKTLETSLADEYKDLVTSAAPDHATARRLFELSTLLRRQGRLDDEVKALQRAISIWESVPNPDYLERGQAQFRLKNYAAALADMEAFMSAYLRDTRPWFSPHEVAACPDVGFRQGILDLMAKKIARDQVPDHFRKERAKILLAMNERDLARVELDHVINPDSGAHEHYSVALMTLAATPTGFHKRCGELVNQLKDCTDADEIYWGVWTCALGPMVEDDTQALTKFLEHARTKLTKDRQSQLSLGGLEFRLGRFAEAEQSLRACLAEPDDANLSPAYAWYFLAMTHERLEQHDQALQWLAKAQESRAQMLAESTKDPASLPWNRRLTLDLLDAEAQAMVKPSEATLAPSSPE